MKPRILRAPTLLRAMQLAAVTAVITLLCLYGIFMETDYGKALFFSYDELWESAQRQQAAGNPREAERLLRHIVVLEENRVTMRFGLFVLFAGPDHLVRAKLKLASMYWHEGRLRDADEAYRDTLAKVVQINGPLTWTYPVAQFHYAEFLADTGRAGEARAQLAGAQHSADAILEKFYWPWQDYEGGHVPAVRALLGPIQTLRQRLGD
jgi:hypothetical protein